MDGAASRRGCAGGAGLRHGQGHGQGQGQTRQRRWGREGLGKLSRIQGGQRHRESGSSLCGVGVCPAVAAMDDGASALVRRRGSRVRGAFFPEKSRGREEGCLLMCYMFSSFIGYR